MGVIDIYPFVPLPLISLILCHGLYHLVLSFHPFYLFLLCYFLPHPSTPPPIGLFISWCWSFSVLRADINECGQLPQPCAHQCVNTPGSFKCTCPPGRHLLGDGKSCAGLERLPSYESYSYSYRSSQSSPGRSPYQQLYRNLASQSFHSHTGATGGRYRGRSRRDTSSQQGLEPSTCPRGFESRGDSCLGNSGHQSVTDAGGFRYPGQREHWYFIPASSCSINTGIKSDHNVFILRLD